MIDEQRSPESRGFWLNFTFDGIVGGAFAWFGFTRHAGSVIEAMAFVLAALVAWPLVEYLFHRWLMHGPVPVIRKAHAEHHSHPRMTPMTPWHVHIFVSVPLWTALAAITSAAPGALLMTGLYLGYIWFRFVHRMVHFHPQTIAARFFGSHLRLHALHHARPDRLYGVTTPFWDRIFGTFSEP